MSFFQTFRGRLLVILALLIVATLGVQFYLNYRTQQENIALRDAQAEALREGMILGMAGITLPDERMADLVELPDQKYLGAHARELVTDVLIIDNKWQIWDSLSEKYWPTRNDDGTYTYTMLADADDLPPLSEGERLGADLQHFPNRGTNKKSDGEAHALPIDTSQGRWYVMVILKNNKSEAAWRAALPLLATLGVLSISPLITFWLVWRFTRPIANLSNAARRVAEGDLAVRVPGEGRTDEMGQLAQRFNEMTAELEKSKELETQLQQAEKSAVIGRLGSAIAHEIRNPLNYINLTLDHLRSKFAPDEIEQRETFNKLTAQLKAEVARINQQITDFLNYSRPAKANLQPLNARQVVEDSLRLVEGQAAENNIKIGVVEHEGVPKIMGDPEFLRSVFNNLFINAVQAMGAAGGSLNVKISPEDVFVRFDVSDTGSGIPPENLAKIFEPYFSTKDTGTGLGLAIVHKIVDVHNGTIDVGSTVENGTRFTLRLPKAG